MAFESQMNSRLEDWKFRLVAESVPSAIVIVNHEGKIVFLNSQIEKIFGYTQKELIGQSVEVLVPERFRGGHSEYRMDFYANPRGRPMGAGRDLFALRKDGTEFPVEIGLNPMKIEEEVLVLAAIVDITERKRAEQKLRESEERLQAIMDNTTDAVMVYDEDGMVIAMNKEARRLFYGDGRRELKSIWDVIPPENRDDFSSRLKSVKDGSRLLDYEMEKILGNGERVPVSVGLTYIVNGGGWFIETIRDIGERVRIRNKIIELEKAQIVGKMAEGIAHHMGTPLSSMLLRVQMVKEDITGITENASVAEKLDSIERQIFYSQRLLQKLLRFARRTEKERSAESISSLIEDGVEMITPFLRRHSIKLESYIKEDVKICADVNLLQLVFSDIMMNAVDAMPEGGRLSIIVSKRNLEGQVQIKISDTGIGIPREILPLVFEPFFTTKPAGKGTGLGLSVAKRIIQDHGGEISIESREGEGTSILISLPTYMEKKTLA
jgi:hypothetical protein